MKIYLLIYRVIQSIKKKKALYSFRWEISDCGDPVMYQFWYKLKVFICILFGRVEWLCYGNYPEGLTYEVALWGRKNYYNGLCEVVSWTQMDIGVGFHKNWKIYVFNNGN